MAQRYRCSYFRGHKVQSRLTKFYIFTSLLWLVMTTFQVRQNFDNRSKRFHFYKLLSKFSLKEYFFSIFNLKLFDRL